VLALATLAALLVSNSAARPLYEALLHAPIEFGFAPLTGAQRWGLPVHAWINDLLMAVFFLLVGLEIKRELVEGELSTPAQALGPVVAALGGMIMPALVYAGLNLGPHGALQGWAIPMATDIAFAVGILTLLGPRVPAALKVFLMALAIIDDLGAIVVIALFYTQGIGWGALGLAAVLSGALFAMNRARVMRLDAYLVTGLLLWACVLQSGLHPTIAGVITALAVPVRDPQGGSPLERAEHALHPWVAFGILPLFAFANAGVPLQGLSPAALADPVPLGIAAGLLLGKPLGVCGAVWLFRRGRGEAGWPGGVSARAFAGLGLLCGIGFTMSLFIGLLAFGDADPGHQLGLKLGVLGGSLLAGGLGAALLASAAAPAGRRG